MCLYVSVGVAHAKDLYVSGVWRANHSSFFVLIGFSTPILPRARATSSLVMEMI